MSLLFLDKPIVINPSLAKVIGLNEAIVLQQIHYWLDKTKSGREYDGKFWIYNTYEQWTEQFPFWSVDTVRRAISSLRKQGLIIAKQLNKSKHDRTNFYTIDYSNSLLFDNGKMHRSTNAECTDLTETTTETNTKTLKPLSGKPDVDVVEKSLIDYLNTLAGRNYKHAPSNIKFLKARLAEGHTPQEIADVIARKCAEWLDDPKFRQYLRPATLFNAEKFNQYVGELGQPLPPKRQAATKPEEIDFDSTGWLRT